MDHKTKMQPEGYLQGCWYLHSRFKLPFIFYLRLQHQGRTIFSTIIHFIENQPVNIKIIISIKILYSINCKNSSTSLFTYIKSKIMVIVTISIRK